MENTSHGIVDMQVNIGRTKFGPDCDFADYYPHAKAMGITKAMIVPTPTHILDTKEGEEVSCLWRPEVATQDRYYKELRKGTELNVINQPQKPYQAFNKHVLHFVQEFNSRREQMKLFFAAKVHPLLDDTNALDGLLSDELVCIKIHGIASHSYPEIFPERFNEFLRYHDLPVLVHTDWYEGEAEKELSPHARALHELYAKNNPPAYIEWATRNRLRVCINHGARLHQESIHIINNEPNLTMGYGPDSLLDVEQDRLATQTTDYAEALFNSAVPEKVIFSTDFRWNVGGRNQWDDLRWNSVERVKKLLSPDDQQKVLAQNAISFFKMHS